MGYDRVKPPLERFPHSIIPVKACLIFRSSLRSSDPVTIIHQGVPNSPPLTSNVLNVCTSASQLGLTLYPRGHLAISKNIFVIKTGRMPLTCNG